MCCWTSTNEGVRSLITSCRSRRQIDSVEQCGTAGEALESFARMYDHHAAIEDTVVFPAWKAAVSEAELDELGGKFEEIEAAAVWERWIRGGAEEDGRDRDEPRIIEPRNVHGPKPNEESTKLVFATFRLCGNSFLCLFYNARTHQIRTEGLTNLLGHPQTLTSNLKEPNMTFIQFADEPNQEERIAKLRAELEKLGGSTTTLGVDAGRHGRRVSAARTRIRNRRANQPAAFAREFRIGSAGA